jgi:hypothetical protein
VKSGRAGDVSLFFNRPVNLLTAKHDIFPIAKLEFHIANYNAAGGHYIELLKTQQLPLLFQLPASLN